MLKEIFSLLDGGDGNIQITANRKGVQYTVSVVPFDKPELSISLVGTIEEIEKDFTGITPKYKAVIKSATEQVEALAVKVKESVKKKTSKKEKNIIVSPSEKEQQELENEATEIIENEQITALENNVEENNKVLDAIPENKDFEKKVVAEQPKVETNNELF